MDLTLCYVFYPENGILLEILKCKMLSCNTFIQRLPHSKNVWCLKHNEEYLLRIMEKD